MSTDFTTMNGPELVAAFNTMCEKAKAAGIDRFEPVTRFATRDKGITRCSTLYLALTKEGVRVNGEGKAPTKPKKETKGKSRKATSTGIEAEFKIREGTNRQKLLRALYAEFKKPVARSVLIKAVYGRETENGPGCLAMVMMGLLKSIDKDKLPYKIVKSKDSKEVYFALQAK